MLRPEVWQGVQERQRVVRLFARCFGWKDFTGLALTEVGCGSGGNLLDFIRFALSHNLCGIELLPERAANAPVFTCRIQYMPVMPIYDIEPGGQNVVFQSVVFSSLLDDGFQRDLANRMWNWVKPGGGYSGMTSSITILPTRMCAVCR